MGKIVVSEFISLDGVIEGPGVDKDFDRDGWAFRFDRGDDGNQFKGEEVFGTDGLLLGRITYEGFASAWPSMTDELGYADKMNNMPKYVVSSTLTDPEWNNTTVISGNVATEVAKLKETAGNLLVMGSSQLVDPLAEADLIDEYRLMVFPIVIGAGKRMFGDRRDSSAMRLVELKQVGPDGVITMVYEPAR